MDNDFWHQRWKNNQIAFHENDANGMLVRYFKELSLPDNSRVFVPLCGKTRDIAWLLSKGHRVVGAELSETAIEQLFLDLALKPAISKFGNLVHYKASSIDIFVGDIFDLSTKTIGPVDAIYDRAALVALPEEMREKYAIHLSEITNSAPQLLVCYEYDQTLMEGPPFSIYGEDVNRLYGTNYGVTFLNSCNIPEGLKGNFAVAETTWLLR